MKQLELTSPFWIPTLPVKMVLCQLTYTTKPTDKHKYLSPELSSKTLHQKYSVQPSSPNQTHLLQWTNYQKTSWGTEMSSEKEGLHYNASINHCFNKASGIDRKDLLQYRKKRIRTTECHLSSHTILRSVMYTPSFVSTGQPYRNTQNCTKYSKNNPSWLSENPKIWKIYMRELTSPCDKLKVTITPSGMIKADRERKVSGLKNSRSCHRM